MTPAIVTASEDETSPRKQIGRTLKRAREHLNLSLKDVSAQIRIRPTLLKALEEGDFSQFSSVTYIKGFIKTYTIFLKIPTQPLLDLYEKDPQKDRKTTFYDISDTKIQNTFPGKKILSFCFILCLGLFLLTYNWEKSDTSPEVDSYKIPERFVALLNEEKMPEETENILLPEEKNEKEEPKKITNISSLEPLGDTALYLTSIPKTNTSNQKKDKLILLPEENGWIELYKGEELLLRTALDTKQQYLLTPQEDYALVIKNGNWLKVLYNGENLPTQKSLHCEDYFCVIP